MYSSLINILSYGYCCRRSTDDDVTPESLVIGHTLLGLKEKIAKLKRELEEAEQMREILRNMKGREAPTFRGAEKELYEQLTAVNAFPFMSYVPSSKAEPTLRHRAEIPGNVKQDAHKIEQRIKKIRYTNDGTGPKFGNWESIRRRTLPIFVNELENEGITGQSLINCLNAIQDGEIRRELAEFVPGVNG